MSITPGGGAWSCPVSFTTNDLDEDPVAWTITGTASGDGSSTPEITVTRSGTPVADGDGLRRGAGPPLAPRPRMGRSSSHSDQIFQRHHR